MTQVKYLEKQNTDEEVYSILNPIVSKWFKEKFGKFTESQKYSLVPINGRRNILISSPTGSGKTLSAFSSILSYLITLAEKKELEDKVYALYISPLKALSSDVYHNLIEPLEEMEKMAGKKFEIRIGVRTGDTSVSERAKMAKKCPHIMISTPESSAILLTSPKFIEKMKAVEFCVVDEIHAMDNKRGTYMSLTLERLNEVSVIWPVKIGLSATIEPLEEVAKFLVGIAEDRVVEIANVQFSKKIDIAVLSPGDLIEDREIGRNMYELLNKLIKEHKTTLIFTNTRSATERVVDKLKEKYPTEYGEDIAAHHSSLSKTHRFNIEDRLRKGELKVVVCLDGDTKVLDRKGNWIKIKDIDEREVQSINSDLKMNNNPIKKLFKIENKEELIKIRSKFGKEIICTKDHKFLTMNRGGNLEWIEAEKFEEDMPLATIRSYKFEAYNKTELDNLILENYPKDYLLFLNTEFLEMLKSNIKDKFKSLKNFWKNYLKEDINYSQFIHILLGEFGMKTYILKKIISLFNIDNLTAFNSIDSVSSSKYRMPKIKIENNLLRLLGFMLAEGYLSKDALFVSNRNKNLLDYYSDIIEKIAGKKPWTKIGSTGTPILGWSSKFCIELFKNMGFKLGRKARTSNIPEFIFRLNSDLVFNFLSAYLDGDGYLEIKNGRVYSAGFCTTSREMAEDLSKLMLREGIITSIRDTYCDCEQELKEGGKIIKKGWFYSVVVTGGENLRKFAENISPVRENLKKIKEVLSLNGYTNRDNVPYIGKKLRVLRNEKKLSSYMMQKKAFNPVKYELDKRDISRKQLKKLLNLYNSNDAFLSNLANSYIFWDRIASKETISDKKFVYNLEIEKDHNYIANGFITKNCSTSLELGIDIGYIDLVIMLGSPKSSARAIQRLGRAGHKLHDTIKGRFIVMDRDDLVECCVIQKEIVERKINRVNFPRNCLDVLSQQIFGMAIYKIWKIDELLGLIRKSYCYSELTREDFYSVLSYLSGEYGDLEGNNVYSKIWIDKEKNEIGKRGRLARVIYLTNIGTIPEESYIEVKLAPSGEHIGYIDEGFLERMKKGDVFVLGGERYMYLYTRGMNLYVRGSVNRPPTIPSWFSEMLPLAFDSALEISRLRQLVKERLEKGERKAEIIDFLKKQLYLEENSAESIYNYFYEQYKFSEMPDSKMILVERFKSEGKNFCVFNSMYGRRVNDALSRAIGYLIGGYGRRDIEIGISDNGFYLAGESLNIEKAMNELNENNLKSILEEAVEKTDILARRFRHCAARSLMILRNYKGKSKSVGKQQVKSHFLLHAVKKMSKDFPILKEARREVLEDLMDIKNSKLVLSWIKDKKVKLRIIDTKMASPFSLGLIIQGHSDLIRMEDKQDFLKRMHELHLKEIGER